MPFYDYRCKSEPCAHVWEAEQPINAEPLTTCPACQQETAARQISTGTLTKLKGRGWFKSGGY